MTLDDYNKSWLHAYCLLIHDMLTDMWLSQAHGKALISTVELETAKNLAAKWRDQLSETIKITDG